MRSFSLVVCRRPAEPAAPAWGPAEPPLTGHTGLMVFVQHAYVEDESS